MPRTFTRIDQDAPKPFLDNSAQLKDYSQNGEGKIVATWLNKIAETNTESPTRWCVEFGAGDGITNSNTRHLTEYFGYQAVLIESSKLHYDLLNRNVHPGSVLFNKMVAPSGENSLDSLLSHTLIPHNFDYLSIDIDGLDYLVWDSFKDYTPKIVSIEFNHSIPSYVNIYQEIGDTNFGASFAAIYDLGLSKGYHLVDATVCNAIFVHSKYTDLCKSIEEAWKSQPFVTSIFFDFDRKPHFIGPMRAPWAEVFYGTEPDFELMTEKELIQAYKEGNMKWDM